MDYELNSEVKNEIKGVVRNDFVVIIEDIVSEYDPVCCLVCQLQKSINDIDFLK